MSRFILRFLKWFCPDHLYEEIEGDLIQKFNRDVKKLGERKAKRRLMWNAIRFFRPAIILRNKFSFELNQLDMIFNHLKFATRIFLKDKFFSTLNVLGLTLGIAVSIILLLILQNDLTYDQHHLNYKRIYRVGCHQQQTGLDFRWARSAMDLGTIIKEELPEIQEVVRIDDGWRRTLVTAESKGEQKAFYEERIMDTDSTYFRVFTHEFISGNPETCLNKAHAAVVTETIARKYFGDDDALGRSLIIDNESWAVTGVIKDLPENTHLKFDLLLSNRHWIMGSKIESENFWNPGIYLYLLVPSDFKPQDFLLKFPALFDKYFKSFGVEVGGKYTPILEPLESIHFYSELDQDEPHGNIVYLYGFTATGIFIILLACINYMNLSTAKAVSRATEIAVKKLVGTRKRVLVFSFLSESILLSLVSLALAILLVYGVLNLTSFSELIGKNLTLDFLHNPSLLIGSLGITLTIGIISGLYPAFYLPSVPLLTALKGTFKNRKSSHLFRKVLITTQFTISIFVVVCTLFMRNQLDYVRNKELGFNKDNVLILPIQDTLVEKQIQVIKNDFLQHPHITAASTADNVVGTDVGGIRNFWGESETGMKQTGFTTLFVGEDYIRTLDLKIIQGEDFKPGPVSQSETPYIANEAAVKLMGWGTDAVGKEMKFFHGEIPGHIVGVVKDFNFKSLHNAVEPLLIIKTGGESGYLHLKVEGDGLHETIAYVKSKWSQYDPNRPFEYFFLDQRFNEQYKADEIQNRLLSLLSYICIFISLLGLIGLSAFTAAQRTKEIGVRKVLGANIPDIIFLLSKDVLFLVILSSAIVIPFSLWVITLWMENFAYQTQLNYLLYFLVTVVAFGFVFLTVLVQSLKTARSNPVDSLKYE